MTIDRLLRGEANCQFYVLDTNIKTLSATISAPLKNADLENSKLLHRNENIAIYPNCNYKILFKSLSFEILNISFEAEKECSSLFSNTLIKAYVKRTYFFSVNL
jgi:hypothetical protein